jgi:hypothetical protein
MSSGHFTQGHSRVLFQSKNIDVLATLPADICGHVLTCPGHDICAQIMAILSYSGLVFSVEAKHRKLNTRTRRDGPISKRRIASSPFGLDLGSSSSTTMLCWIILHNDKDPNEKVCGVWCRNCGFKPTGLNPRPVKNDCPLDKGWDEGKAFTTTKAPAATSM